MPNSSPPISDDARVALLKRQRRDRLLKRKAARMDAVVTRKLKRMSVAEYAVAEGMSLNTVYRLIDLRKLKTSRQLTTGKRRGKLMVEVG